MLVSTSADDEESRSSGYSESAMEVEAERVVPVKKSKGRPKKEKVATPPAEEEEGDAAEEEDEVEGSEEEDEDV